MIDTKKINNLEFDGIDHKDFPEYCDVYIISADCNGEKMNEQQLEELNNNRDFVYEKLFDYLF